MTSSSAQSVTLAITECEFEECSAPDGGGVYLTIREEMSLTVSGCSFEMGNVSESGGSSIGVYNIELLLNN